MGAAPGEAYLAVVLPDRVVEALDRRAGLVAIVRRAASGSEHDGEEDQRRGADHGAQALSRAARPTNTA